MYLYLSKLLKEIFHYKNINVDFLFFLTAASTHPLFPKDNAALFWYP